MDFTVNFIYKAIHPKPLSVNFHTHNCYELVFYSRGEGTVKAGEQHFKYTKNTIIIIPPNTMHNEVNYRESCNFVMGFNTDSDFSVPFGIFDASNEIISILDDILLEKRGYAMYSREIITLQLQRMFYLLKRTDSKYEHKNSFSLILNNIDNYIEENISLPISVSDFAQMYNYSSERFRHIFTENVGISPKRYVISKRIERAKLLLKTTNTSITHIAHECGFYDVSQFTKMFRNICGCVPTEYRTQYNKKR